MELRDKLRLFNTPRSESLKREFRARTNNLSKFVTGSEVTGEDGPCFLSVREFLPSHAHGRIPIEAINTFSP